MLQPVDMLLADCGFHIVPVMLHPVRNVEKALQIEQTVESAAVILQPVYMWLVDSGFHIVPAMLQPV